MPGLYDDPSFQTSHDWATVPAATKVLLTDLGSQFDQLTGGTQPLPYDLLAAMAYAGVADLFQMGQFIESQGAHFQPELANTLLMHPGAAYGMTDDSYKHQVSLLREEVTKETGLAQGDISSAAVQQALENQWTAPEWVQHLKDDPTTTDTYGWMKLGMDYQQFQQAKSTLNISYGHQMDNQEALTHLQEQHALQSARGGTREVTMQPQTAFQPVKQADPLSLSEVR